MFTRSFLLLLVASLVSCALPDTELWKDRGDGNFTKMPMELATKVMVHGTGKSIVSNPVSGTHKGVSMWWQRSRLLRDSLLKQRPLLDEAYARGGNIEEALDLMEISKGVPGRVDCLIDGPEFFEALYQSVKKAEHRIDTQVFIFDNDDVATEFADLLKERSQDVQCRVLMDRLGSIGGWWSPPETPMRAGFRPPSSMPHYLEEGSHVQVRESMNPWLVADHTKLILIDQNEAYLGGMNIGREYLHEWHDMMVRVRGPVITELQNIFDESWKMQGMWGDWDLLFSRKKKPDLSSPNTNNYPIRILRTGAGVTDIEKAILVAIRMSRKRIDLQNSYVTSEVLLQELLAARRRGVEVNFIYPQRNDAPLMEMANQRFAASLMEAGGNVFVYPGFSHLKAVVVDDWVCLGSANLDGLSLRINSELNIAYSNAKAVEVFRKRVFETDMKKSRRLRKGELKDLPPLLSHPVIQQL